MIQIQLGEQTATGDKVELPIEVTLNPQSTDTTALPTNITFTLTLTNPVTQVKVTYSYTEPNLLRVVEGGQTFQIEGE